MLGRLCTEVARILRGKHKPIFAPHLDTGDHVVIVNADKVVLTSGKADREMVYRYSGYPGGIKTETLRRAARPQARRCRAPQRPRHAAEGPARPPDARTSSRCTPAPSTPTPRSARAARPLRRQGPLTPERRPDGHQPLTQTTGRRKEAVARARLRPGTGAITINGRPFDEVLPDAGAPDGRQRAAARHRGHRGATTSTPRSTAAASAARPARCAWRSPVRSSRSTPRPRRR